MGNSQNRLIVGKDMEGRRERCLAQRADAEDSGSGEASSSTITRVSLAATSLHVGVTRVASVTGDCSRKAHFRFGVMEMIDFWGLCAFPRTFTVGFVTSASHRWTYSLHYRPRNGHINTRKARVGLQRKRVCYGHVGYHQETRQGGVESA